MQGRFCCEEMTEFVRSLEKAGDELKETKVFFDANSVPEEMAMGLSCKTVFIPNIIFRFCPFCGTLLQGDGCKTEQKDDSVVGKLSAIAFNSDLDDDSSSLACKLAMTQEAISQMRAILKNAVVSNKPVTGFIKTS